MEDLVPFLIFIVIALINVIKFVLEKGAKNKRPPAIPGEEPPEKKPNTIEAFFESLAGKLEPQPIDKPNWPEGYERPDYMKEQEAFEADPPEAFETPVAEFIPMPPPEPAVLNAVLETKPVAQAETMKMAMKSMPSSIASMKGLRLASPSILRSSSAGRIDFSLKDKAKLRQAIIANIIFSPPRAYGTELENTVVK